MSTTTTTTTTPETSGTTGTNTEVALGALAQAVQQDARDAVASVSAITLGDIGTGLYAVGCVAVTTTGNVAVAAVTGAARIAQNLAFKKVEMVEILPKQDSASG